MTWTLDRILHFEPGDFVRSGVALFGFHTTDGRYYGTAHLEHYLGLVGSDGHLVWTAGVQPVFDGVPNIQVELSFPIYVDTLGGGTLLVSNFGDARMYLVDPDHMAARMLVDGRTLGMADMGNCVVDGDGSIWVNEVTGCRVWKFAADGRPLESLGDGTAGFHPDEVAFDAVRFDWIYDMRRGPDGKIWVLDSRNFALREIDPFSRTVRNLAGNGQPGYTGDGGDARRATSEEMNPPSSMARYRCQSTRQGMHLSETGSTTWCG